MKILIIFTGGTIGSAFQNGLIDLDRDKPYKLIEAYRNRYGMDFDYETAEPVNFLSENSTGSLIMKVISAVKDGIKEDYDGIIVTHGTDTLQYTAAAAGYCIGNESVPVCFVSADRPIEDKQSNGLINFHHAISFIRQACRSDRMPRETRSQQATGFGGVWVIYRDHGSGLTSIHRATRLLAHSPFSSALHSIKDMVQGVFDDDDCYIPNKKFAQKEDEIKPFPTDALDDICESIMRIDIYPGEPVPYVSKAVRHIILGSYHSGTVNTEHEEYRRFFDTMHERGIGVFLTGAPDSDAYASTAAYERLHISPVPFISPIALYMKLWLADSIRRDPEETVYRSLAGDILVSC